MNRSSLFGKVVHSGTATALLANMDSRVTEQVSGINDGICDAHLHSRSRFQPRKRSFLRQDSALRLFVSDPRPKLRHRAPALRTRRRAQKESGQWPCCGDHATQLPQIWAFEVAWRPFFGEPKNPGPSRLFRKTAADEW